MSVELAEIVGVLSREYYPEPPTLAAPGSAPTEPVPEQWRPILASDDAETRRLTALALWNREFLDLVPDLWEGQIPWTRLLIVTLTDTTYYCVSPELPPGQAVQVYEGEPDDPEDFGSLLDEVMMASFG